MIAAPGFVVRRIVVAADSSDQSHAALEAAAALAARLDAEIEGLFVEDIDLVHLAELPFGREVHPISGETRVFDKQAIETQLRAEAAGARRALKAVAERARVRSTFRVVRGRVTTEVITAANEGDLLILGVHSRSVGPRPRPGATAIAAARGAPRSVLLLRRGDRITGKALVAYDGSDGAELALAAAAWLAGVAGGKLTALLVAESSAEADRLQTRVGERLESTGLTPNFLRAPRLELDEMCRLSQESGSDVLVLNADNPVLADDAHGRLLEQIRCPVLLVR